MTQPSRMLGRRAPKNAPALRAASFLKVGAVPPHPPAADHFAAISTWDMLGNDRYGDCGPASVEHQRMLVTRYLTGTACAPSLADTLALYKASGNPDFDPNDPGGAGDGGVDMQTMCEALVAVGIGGVKALGFAKVDVSNLDEVRAAIAVFGSLLLGVNLDTAQQNQSALWDYAPSSAWGGHAVLAGRYTSASVGDDIAVVTWGEVVGTTDAFWAHQVEEAWVVIWPEHLGAVEFEQGVDRDALAADYLALTGRPFPVQPQPGPAPEPAPPVVDAADRALAPLLRRFVNEHHVSHELRALAGVAKAWLLDKEL